MACRHPQDHNVFDFRLTFHFSLLWLYQVTHGDLDSYFEEGSLKEEKFLICKDGSNPLVYKDEQLLAELLSPYSFQAQSTNVVTKDISSDDFSNLAEIPSPMLWIDVHRPSQNTLALLTESFRLHSFTVEDCLSENDTFDHQNEVFESYRYASTLITCPTSMLLRPFSLFLSTLV